MNAAIILYGPPGSGKSTQANLIANQLGLIHFDTGRLLESVVHDPKRQKDIVIRRERKLFDGGKLMTPSFVLGEVLKHVQAVAQAGWGLVFSGSPRTLDEAKGLIPLLQKLYGKKMIFPFVIKVSEKTSIARNSKRLVCRICATPLLTQYYPSSKPRHCPVCAGPLYRRSLDDPETIRVRLKEYHVRTEPIFKFLRSRGFLIRKVQGMRAPYKVFQSIYDSVKNSR